MSHQQESHPVDHHHSPKSRFPGPDQRKFILGGSLIAFTVLGMIGIALYVSLSKTPANILDRIQENFLNVTTFEYLSKTTLKIVPDGSATSSSKNPYAAFADGIATITLAGKTNLAAQNPDSEFSFELASQSTFAKDFSFKGETKYVGDIFYARLINLSANDFIPADIADGTWVYFDLKNLRATGKTTYNPEEAQIADQKIRKAFKESRVISAINKLPDTIIEGKSTYHYELIIDNEGLRSFIEKTGPILYPEGRSQDLEARADYYAQMLSDMRVEVWVGKKDLLPYKIMTDITISDPPTSSAKLEVVTEVAFTNYNKPFVVEAPKESITLEAFTQKLYGKNPYAPKSTPIMPTSTTTREAIGVDADKDGLTDEAERQYGTNPLLKDTDKDGFSDFEELIGGYDPLGPGKILK